MPQNFVLAFIDELEKQIIIKNLLKWATKKQNSFNIYNVAFKKKITKKNTCRYHYQNLDDMIYSSWDIEQNILKLVNLGHFFPFYLPPLKTQKSKFWKMKNFAGDIIISQMCTTNHNHIMYGSWDTKWDRQNFLSFWAIFCPFTTPPLPTNTHTSPLMTPKITILK